MKDAFRRYFLILDGGILILDVVGWGFEFLILKFDDDDEWIYYGPLS